MYYAVDSMHFRLKLNKKPKPIDQRRSTHCAIVNWLGYALYKSKNKTKKVILSDRNSIAILKSLCCSAGDEEGRCIFKKKENSKSPNVTNSIEKLQLRGLWT